MADSHSLTSRQKRWVLFVVVFFSIIFGLGVLEILLRIWQPVQIRMMGSQILLQRNKVIENNFEFNSPKISNHIVIKKNSLGFRGEEPPVNFSKRLSLVAVGGSTTECVFITEGKTWVDIVSKNLKTKIPELWVNNAGIDGHSTCGHIALVDQYLSKLRPDFAMFLVGINDMAVEDCRVEDKKQLVNSQVAQVTSKFKNSMVYSYIYYLVNRKVAHGMVAMSDSIFDYNVLGDSTFYDKFNEEDEQRYKRLLEAYRERLLELVAKSKLSGIRPIFITQPAVYGQGMDPTTGVDLSDLVVADFTEDKKVRKGIDKWMILEKYNQVTREVAQKNSLPLIDLAKEMPKDSKYYYDFVHYTEIGAQKVGEIISTRLEEVLTKTNL